MTLSEPDECVRLLTTAVQHYAWGSRGKDSRVAQLIRKSKHGYTGCTGSSRDWVIDDEQPFAELWVGDHPSGTCLVHLTETGSPVELSDYIAKHCVANEYGTEKARLPFLLKCLSVSTALSIQLHPDKNVAEELNDKDCLTYPDKNHKPEVALALTEFEALCGFRDPLDFLCDLRKYPDLLCLMQEGILDSPRWAHNGREVMLDCLERCLQADGGAIETSLCHIESELSKQKLQDLSPQEMLFLRLHQCYPADVGVLASFFFQYWKLLPSEALFIPPNVPHCYLRGDCIECMASSDNVVRGGLTPKKVDADLFIQLSRTAASRPTLVEAQHLSTNHRVYRPPTDEFEIHFVTISPGCKENVMIESGHLLLGIVLSGHLMAGTVTLSEGDCFTLRGNKVTTFGGVGPKNEFVIASAPKPNCSSPHVLVE